VRVYVRLRAHVHMRVRMCVRARVRVRARAVSVRVRVRVRIFVSNLVSTLPLFISVHLGGLVSIPSMMSVMIEKMITQPKSK